MLLTTTNNIEGKKITQYYGIVSGETIIGANVFKDFFAGAMDLYNSNASDEQVSKVMSEKLHRQISVLKKKEYKKTATFHLTKEKGVWVVEDMDDDNNEAALNILSGGMLDAENSIDRMTDD